MGDILKGKCTQCQNFFHIYDLKSDHIFSDKLLCIHCYHIRPCYVCMRELPLKLLYEDEYMYDFVCEMCYNYDIMLCNRCVKPFHSKNLYLQEDGSSLCDRCNYYNHISDLDKIEKN
jgi:hypothetical protein